MEMGIDRYLKEQFQIPEVDIRTYSPLTLAYIGDGIYDLVIRSVVVAKGNTKASELHKRTSQIVKAHTQAEMMEILLPLLTEEEEGIYRLFGNCRSIRCKMGGVRIDGELRAYTIGSYAPGVHMAIVHVEKADVNFRGLYNFINQQFIVHEFPEAVLVNREDDLGQENLRQAKLSYRPIRLEEKFSISEVSRSES